VENNKEVQTKEMDTATDSAAIVVGDVLAECEPACITILEKAGVSGEKAIASVDARKTSLGFSGAGWFVFPSKFWYSFLIQAVLGVLPRKLDATFEVTLDDLCPDNLLTVSKIAAKLLQTTDLHEQVLQVFLMDPDEFEKFEQEPIILGSGYKEEEGVSDEYIELVWGTLIKIVLRAHRYSTLYTYLIVGCLIVCVG
jgi:hypothetical protein